MSFLTDLLLLSAWLDEASPPTERGDAIAPALWCAERRERPATPAPATAASPPAAA